MALWQPTTPRALVKAGIRVVCQNHYITCSSVAMLGTLLGGRYKIITILGAGGFGQTFLAQDTQLSRRCVVKQFKPASRDTKFLEVARRLFETEVSTLRRLGQHDQIPELYDSFEADNEFYLVQEYISGQSLSDEFARRHTLNEAEVVALLQDVLGVLQFVHQHQVIHRDIKPGNLIRRKADGKIVLIDFGAVKEIQTQITNIPGQTSFTVGIGTQGYTPSEQLMGRPRFCSDIYALGMTAIQAVTGLQPSQLPDDPHSFEILWKDHAKLSPGLTFILDRMIRYEVNQRYQSVEDVLRALQRLAELPTNLTEIPSSLLLPESLLNQDWTQPIPQKDWRSRLKEGVKAIAIATVAVSGLVLGVRHLGWLEPPERAVYDQLTRLQPAQTADPRLLIVGITEADLQALQRPTPSDASVAQALATLQTFQPRAIGLDLYRDLPQAPGRDALLEQLRAENVITILKIGDTNTSSIPAPPNVPAERVGFSDFPVDADNVIRRNLMFASLNGTSYYSFSVRLALIYLKAEGIIPQTSPTQPPFVEIGEQVFVPLEPNSGGYQRMDAAGYQILLKYRSPQAPARVVSFSDVLAGRVEADWVRDKIVLMGTTAPSGKDLYYTPFSAGEQTDHQMPGVEIHAQMTSQILGAVLDGTRLIEALPDWVEVIWVVGWSVVGGAIAWFVRHPALLGLATLGAIGVLSGVTVVLFGGSTWLPAVAPLVALFVADVGVAAYRTYRDFQDQQELTRLWQSGATLHSSSKLDRKS